MARVEVASLSRTGAFGLAASTEPAIAKTEIINARNVRRRFKVRRGGLVVITLGSPSQVSAETDYKPAKLRGWISKI
jgi:hypothetical protein